MAESACVYDEAMRLVDALNAEVYRLLRSTSPHAQQFHNLTVAWAPWKGTSEFSVQQNFAIEILTRTEGSHVYSNLTSSRP